MTSTLTIAAALAILGDFVAKMLHMPIPVVIISVIVLLTIFAARRTQAWFHIVISIIRGTPMMISTVWIPSIRGLLGPCSNCIPHCQLSTGLRNLTASRPRFVPIPRPVPSNCVGNGSHLTYRNIRQKRSTR